jgi:hypothetical protein
MAYSHQFIGTNLNNLTTNLQFYSLCNIHHSVFIRALGMEKQIVYKTILLGEDIVICAFPWIMIKGPNALTQTFLAQEQ